LIVRKLFVSLCAAILLAGSIAPCLAKDDAKNTDSATKPVAILSIASYDRIMADVALVGNLAGNPDLDKNLEGMLKLFTQGQGLNGLDQTRPWGVTLSTDGLSFQPLVFLPVKSTKQLLESLAPLIGEPQDGADGIQELEVFNQKILIKDAGAWCFVGQSAEVLSAVPKDPTKLLDGLDKAYDVGLRLYVQNIPEVYRSLAIDQLRLGVENGMSRLPDESDDAFEGRKKLAQQQIEAITTAINDVEQLTLGAALDLEAKSAHIDLTIGASSGSNLGKQVSQLQLATSDFAGFLVDDAAASLNVTAKVAKTDAEHIVAGLSALRARALQHIESESKIATDEASKKIAKEMVGEIFDAIGATLATGRIDAGATLQLSDTSMALAVGAYVADPQALEKALHKFAELAKKEPKFKGIKFDADKHGDVRFHTTTIEVPKDAEIKKVLGDTLDVSVGIGAKSAYLAAGRDSLKLVKQLIDKSKADASKKLPPFQLNVSLAPIFQFASAMQDSAVVKSLAEQLAKSKGKDHVSIVVTPEGNALKIRLEGQEGVLRLLANAGKAATQAGGAAPISP
jgi:hypothetical protein